MALKFQTVSSRIVMDLRRERKSLLKVREQQQAELEGLTQLRKGMTMLEETIVVLRLIIFSFYDFL